MLSPLHFTLSPFLPASSKPRLSLRGALPGRLCQRRQTLLGGGGHGMQPVQPPLSHFRVNMGTGLVQNQFSGTRSGAPLLHTLLVRQRRVRPGRYSLGVNVLRLKQLASTRLGLRTNPARAFTSVWSCRARRLEQAPTSRGGLLAWR